MSPPAAAAAWLERGTEYLVLEVDTAVNGAVFLRLDDLDGVPGIFDSQLFTCVSTEIPRNWVISLDQRGSLQIGPASWLAPGFWERYFNDETRAVQAFKRERRVILETSESALH